MQMIPLLPIGKWWTVIGVFATAILYFHAWPAVVRGWKEDRWLTLAAACYFIGAWPYWVLDYYFGTWWRRN